MKPFPALVPPRARIHPMWLAWASKLDDGEMRYLLPEEYDVVRMRTGQELPYVLVHDRLDIYVVGPLGDAGEFGHFWPSGPSAPVLSPRRAASLAEFARVAQKDMDADENRKRLWEIFFRNRENNAASHKSLLRHLGKLFGVCTEGRELSRTRMVLLAESRSLFPPALADGELDEISAKAVRRGYLEMENHHYEFRGAEGVDVRAFFIELLARHLRNDPDDGGGGWLVLEQPPQELITEWEIFREIHRARDATRDLYRACRDSI